MAGTTTNRKRTAPSNSDLYDAIVAVNKLIVDVETLRAGLDAVCDLLDADGGVTGTTYAATAAVATASTMTAAKIADPAGTVFA